MFIVIDGIDWSWKYTQIKELEKELIKRKKTVKLLDFPRYDNQSTYMIQKYLNLGYKKNISSKQISLLFALDRFDASDGISKDLDKYDYVISNRYTSSNLIHHLSKIDKFKQEEFIKWVLDFEYNILKVPKPDITIVLLVSPNISKELIKKKK